MNQNLMNYPEIKSIAVFCGSSKGNNPIYIQEVQKLGKLLASKNIEVAYGGGHVGIMGACADSCMAAGGSVYGVIPTFFKEREVAHEKITELVFVESMHQRKALLSERASAYLILPGGIGTMDEFFEIFTWANLQLHTKPIFIFNVNGFYDPLLNLIDHMISEGFLAKSKRDLLIIVESAEDLATKL